ncbi:MAG: hypothetical protein M3P51_04565 [Chloroflexota bacterium]|nr:hypothetical protein [Chloroflexota bacterium]
MLTKQELAEMRADVRETLTDSCTVKRTGTPVSDGMGGQTATEQTLGPHRCRVTPPTTRGEEAVRFQGKDRVTGDQAIARSLWTVRLEALTDIRENDRIEVNGLSLEVLSVSGGHTDEIARLAQCLKVS